MEIEKQKAIIQEGVRLQTMNRFTLGQIYEKLGKKFPLVPIDEIRHIIHTSKYPSGGNR